MEGGLSLETETTAMLDRAAAQEGEVASFSVGGIAGPASASALRRFVRSERNRDESSAMIVVDACFNDLVNLDGVSFGVPMVFRRCEFRSGLTLDGADLAEFVLEDCSVGWLTAIGTAIRRSFHLINLNAAGKVPDRPTEEGRDGSVSITGMTVGGDLLVSGSVGFEADQYAIRAEQIDVGRTLSLSGLTALGEVSFVQAMLRSEFHARSTVIRSSRRSLRLNGARIAGSVWLGKSASQPFESFGRVEMLNTQVEGIISLAHARLSNPAGVALDGERCVAVSVYVREGCSSEGQFSLANGRIAADVEFDSFVVDAPGQYALNLGGTHVGGRVKADGGLRLRGSLRINRAHIGGIVALHDLQVTEPRSDWAAIIASGCRVDGEFILKRATIRGRSVNLDGASIGGALDLRGASIFCGEGVPALSIYGSTIGRDLWLGPDGDTSAARVRDSGGQLLSVVEGDVIVEHTRVLGSINFQDLEVSGSVSLAHSEVQGGVMLKRWVVTGKASLNDLRTASIDDSPFTVALDHRPRWHLLPAIRRRRLDPRAE